MPQINRRELLKRSGARLGLISAFPLVSAEQEVELKKTAKEQVAERTNSDVSVLVIDAFGYPSYSELDEEYFDAKIRNTETKQVYKELLKVEDSTSVDRKIIQNLQKKSYRQKYGKLTPDLHRKFNDSDAGEQVKVNVWLDPIDRDAAKKAVGLDVNSNSRQKKLELIDKKKELISAKTAKVAEKITNELSSVSLLEVSNATTFVGVEGQVRDIHKIEEYPEVTKIRPRGGAFVPALGSSTRTHGSYSKRDSDYNAAGYNVGILDVGHPNKNSVDVTDVYESSYQEKDHAAKVASCAASTDGSKPGLAHDAGVYAAWAQDPDDNSCSGRTNISDRISWFRNQPVSGVNVSLTSDPSCVSDACSRVMTDDDFTFGKFVIDNNVPIIGISGNAPEACSSKSYNVRTPSKAFNLITTGAIDDENDGDWSNDDLASYSCYIDPDSKYADSYGYPHDKPEVAAVGSHIYTPNVLTAQKGTSYAAPHVTGLLALLSKFSDDYGGTNPDIWPTLAKVVPMAAAKRHVGSFDETGAGAFTVPRAEEIMKNKWYDATYFYADDANISYTCDVGSSTSEVRVALSWLTDVDQASFTDPENAHSDIDLDLYVYDPNGDPVTNSAAYDRGWEFLTFSPSTTGNYELRVVNSSWQASDDYRDISIAWYKE